MRDLELAQVRESAVRRCLAAGANRHDAEDCAQEAVLALLADPALDRMKSPVAWASTVAYRRYVDLLRRRGREQVAAARLGDERDRTVPGPDEAVTDRELASWLVDRLHQLPARTRQVCSATGQGADPASIAKHLGLTRRSVESHLTRARRWLRTAAAGTFLPPWLVVALRRLTEPAATPVTATVAVTAAAVVVALTVPSPFGGAIPEPTRSPVRPSPGGTSLPPTGPTPAGGVGAPSAAPSPTGSAAPSGVVPIPQPSLLLPSPPALPRLPSPPPLLDDVPLPVETALPALPRVPDPGALLPDPEAVLSDPDRLVPEPDRDAVLPVAGRALPDPGDAAPDGGSHLPPAGSQVPAAPAAPQAS